METVQWSQENRAITTATTCGSNKGVVVQDEKHGINCKRCSSTNTKFCYYNNYSLSQPRYFCKTCKRYWTEGGSLRNIPVGGISRKNMKRISSPDSSSSPPKKMILQQYDHDHDHDQNLVQVPRSSVDHEEKRQDLNLGLIPSEQSNMFKTITELIQVPDFDKNDTLNNLQHPNYSNYLFMPTINNASNHYHQLGSFHDQEDTHMMRRPAMLFPFQEIKQVERKSSDAGGYRINGGGGVLGTGLW